VEGTDFIIIPLEYMWFVPILSNILRIIIYFLLNHWAECAADYHVGSIIGRLEYVEILVEGTDFIIILLEYEVFKKN
jgi:hypothetical protein